MVVHPLPASWDQPVDAETRLRVNKALAVRRRHGRYVRRGGGSPRSAVVVVSVRLVHQVGWPRLVLQVAAGVVHLVPGALHRGFDILLRAERAGRPRRCLSMGQRRDPLMCVAERVAVALQRVVTLQQALRVPVRRGLLHAAGLRVHDGCAGGEDVVVVRRCGRHDSRSRTGRSY